MFHEADNFQERAIGLTCNLNVPRSSVTSIDLDQPLMLASARNVPGGRYLIFTSSDTGRARQIAVAGRYRCEIALSLAWEQVEVCRRLLSQHRLPKGFLERSPCSSGIVN